MWTMMMIVLVSTMMMMNGNAKAPKPSPPVRKKLGKAKPSPPLRKKLGKAPKPSPPLRNVGQLGFVRKLGGTTITANLNGFIIEAVEGRCPHHAEKLHTDCGIIDFCEVKFKLVALNCPQCDEEFQLIRLKEQ